jgi:predicted regulator of Ras-like GTPase activity (Roadblock/LC7/MglB family)
MEYQTGYFSRFHKLRGITMSSEVYTFALQNTLTEIQNISKDVKNSFLFDKKANVIAGDVNTSEATMSRVLSCLEVILEKGDTIGGLDSLVIEGSKRNVHITSVSDMFLTLVASKDADMKYLHTISRALIPTMIRLLDKLDNRIPATIKHIPPSQTLFEPPEEELPLFEDDEQPEVEEIEGPKQEEIEEVKEKDNLPELELPSNQLIVESFGGLLVRSDTVQISKDIMSEWQEFVDGEEINFVEIEAFNGEAKQYKVKTVDESKLENKAVIRIPEKACRALDIKRGELVRVKPVVV